MAVSIPTEELDAILLSAQRAGVVKTWTMGRGKRGDGWRYFHISFADGSTRLFTPGQVQAFGVGLGSR